MTTSHDKLNRMPAATNPSAAMSRPAMGAVVLAALALPGVWHKPRPKTA